MFDSAYLKIFSEFQAELRTVASYKAKLERLDKLGVPKGTLMFSAYTKTYTKKDGSVSRKTYTNLYSYKDRQKTHISRKENRDGLLIMQLAERSKIKISMKSCSEQAKLLCNLMNVCKPRGTDNIDFEMALQSEYENFIKSDQYMLAISELDESLMSKNIALREYGRPKFKNSIYLNDLERLRSKNELIAAFCLNDSGFSYVSEPEYTALPSYFSDFALMTGDRTVYIEIAGMMTDPDYKDHLLRKCKSLVNSGSEVVIIDMTDYPDENGVRQTQLHFDKLKKIFLDIGLGRIKCKGEILRAC